MPSPETFNFDVGMVSYDRFSTLHYKQAGGLGLPRQNQDAAYHIPGVGVFVADGLGGEAGGSVVSQLAVIVASRLAQRLDIRDMGASEAIDAAHDVLYYTDKQIGDYKAENPAHDKAATTLGALIFARRHLIAVGVGDTPVFRYGAQPNDRLRNLTQLTEEQCEGRFLTNYMDGEGRPPYSYRERDVEDIVLAVPMEDGDRYLIATDGLLGDEPEQRIPTRRLHTALARSACAQGAANVLGFLPANLALEQAQVEVEGELVWYEPKIDDLTVATLFVNAA